MHKLTLSISTCFMVLVWTISVFAAVPGSVTCRVETDRSVLPAGGPQTVILKVTLDAPVAPAKAPRPKVNIALVLDRSGSMSGTKLNMAKEAAIEAVSRLGRDDMFSLVTYDTNVHTLVPAQPVRDINGMIQVIQQIQSGGSTALFGGVSQGAAEIRKSLEGDFIHRVVLLSDGIANVGPQHPDDLGRLGAGLFKENISVTTIGVGNDYNEDLMTQLSQKSDGNTYFAESGVDLPRIFGEELGKVLNVVAKQVIVTITLPDGVTPVEIIGREGRVRGNRIELSMNQLYGGQEKFALIQVRLPQSRAGHDMTVATAKVTYQDPFAMKVRSATGAAMAQFSRDPAKVKASTNVKVVRDYQLNLNALAQEEAISLSDQGNPEAAAQALRKSAEKLKALGTAYKDNALIQEAQESEAQAATLERHGMSKKSRKMLRTKSYQMKNQQIKN